MGGLSRGVASMRHCAAAAAARSGCVHAAAACMNLLSVQHMALLEGEEQQGGRHDCHAHYHACTAEGWGSSGRQLKREEMIGVGLADGVGGRDFVRGSSVRPLQALAIPWNVLLPPSPPLALTGGDHLVGGVKAEG